MKIKRWPWSISARGHLRKRIAICREIEDESSEAIGRREFRRVLVYQGNADAKEELNKAYEINNKRNNWQVFALSPVFALLKLIKAQP